MSQRCYEDATRKTASVEFKLKPVAGVPTSGVVTVAAVVMVQICPTV